MRQDEEQLRAAMRGYAAQIAASHAAPAASAVWMRAERRRRRLARERAERPLRIMQAVGMVCAAAVAAWLLYRAAPANLSLSWEATSVAVGMTAVIVAACWTMLAASRRSSLF